jgi:tetratricopeptide (TPR) repeat protein
MLMKTGLMRNRRLPTTIALVILGFLLLRPAATRGQESNRAKAAALVDAAIKMTDSEQAVKLLWQATDIDPTLNEAYLYLGLYYNSREDFAKVVEVYKKLVKNEPKGPSTVSAYLNIGEAYMAFTPPHYDDALAYYRKAYEMDPTSSLAALRIGEIMAHEGNRTDALRFLKQASADKSAGIAAEARKVLNEIGAPL